MSRPSHSEHVLLQLNSQREWGFLCDCCIAIGDVYFRAHKAVLAACSSYFRMMFSQDHQGPARLDLSGLQISAECFDLVLQLMYLGRTTNRPLHFEELKAAMAYLQMYYIPDSLEDLTDTRVPSLAPSSSSSLLSSSSSSSLADKLGGRLMFGVRMYEQLKQKDVVKDQSEPAGNDATTTTESVRVGNKPTPPPAPPTCLPQAPPPILPPADPKDKPSVNIRKRTWSRNSSLKERPRFGRKYTCDHCGFAFSCEKLLMEHIVTCGNGKVVCVTTVCAEADSVSSKAGHSSSKVLEERDNFFREESNWLDHKFGPDELKCTVWPAGGEIECQVGSPDKIVIIKVEPEESVEIGMVKGNQTCFESKNIHLGFEDSARNLNLSTKLNNQFDPNKEVVLVGTDAGTATIERQVKKEESNPCMVCLLCGIQLTGDDQLAHCPASHTGHVPIQGESHEVGLYLPEEASAPEGQLIGKGHLHHNTEKERLLGDGPRVHRRKAFIQNRRLYGQQPHVDGFTCQTCGEVCISECDLQSHMDIHRGTPRATSNFNACAS